MYRQKIKIDGALSEIFAVETGLKQGDTLFYLLLNLARENLKRQQEWCNIKQRNW